MASLALTFDILARDKASSEFKKVGDAAEDAGKRGSTSIGSMSGALKGVGAALAGSAIVAGLGRTISAASDLNETVNKSNVIFGANSQAIQRWASGASKNLGLSKGAALEAASGFGNMFTQLGFTGDAATDMSTQVVQLSADLGSFNNLPTAEVADMMSAAFRGEFDSLQRLIPNINAARVEQEAMAATGKKNAKELTAQEKAAATLAIVQRDGAAAAGDFAKTSDGLANSSKIAAAQFEDLQASIGQKFLPAATGAMRFLSDTAIPVLGGVFDGVFAVAGAFADLPGPVKAGVGALGAVALLNGPLSGTLQTLKGFGGGLGGSVKGTFGAFSEALGYARKNGEGLGTVLKSVGSYAGGTLRSGLKGIVDMLGGPWGAAMAGAAVGIALVTSAISKTNAQLDGWTQSLNEGGEAARNARAEMAAYASSNDDFELIGRWIGENLGLVDSIDDVKRANRSYWESLDPIAQAQAKVSEWTSTLSTRLGTLGEKHADTIIAQQRLAHWTGELEGRQSRLAAATEEGAKTGGYFGDVLSVVGGFAADTADNVKDLADELNKLRGGSVDAAEAEINLADQIRSAADATDNLTGSVVKANGRLDLHTEAGGAAYRALVDVADASNDVIGSLRDQGKSAEQMAARDRELRGSFIKTAMQMGIGRQEAKRLADQILGTPKERSTKFNADTKAANNAVDGFQSNIAATKGKTINITASVTASLKSILGGFGLNWIGNARGNIIEAFANGGLKSMRGGVATVVPPNTWRVIGDRVRDDEAYIPINSSARSRSILGETASRMGYNIKPMAAGGVNLVANFDDRQAAADIRSFNSQLRKLLEPGTGLVGALQWARTQVGKPYLWGGVGPTGYDCSGFMSAITNVALGKSPYSRRGSTATFPWSGFASGLGQFTIGSTKNAGGGIGHMAGTIMGVNVESAGSVGVRVGSAARGALDPLFGTRAHLAMANGGVIKEPVFGFGARSGNSYSFGERGPETVTPGVRGGRTEIVVHAYTTETDRIARKIAEQWRIAEVLRG